MSTRVLVVDDEHSLTNVVASYLEQLAEIRLYAADAEGAIELLRQATALLPPREAAARVRVCTGLGQALVQLGKHGEAREVRACRPGQPGR